MAAWFANREDVRQTGVLWLLLLSLVGCAFSPEQAIVQEVRELNESWQDQTLDPQTIQVLQTQPWGKDLIGLVTFQTIRKTRERQECLFQYQVTRQNLQWGAGRGGGGCGPIDGDGRPISVGSGQHLSSQEGAWSSTSGTVYVGEGVGVRVLWDDGEEQQVVLVQGHFMAVRAGVHSYSRVEVLGADGAAILSHEPEPPAAGKVDR